jgi:hypothetical protein
MRDNYDFSKGVRGKYAGAVDSTDIRFLRSTVPAGNHAVLSGLRKSNSGGINMNEPGLDNRHRDKDGEIQQKRGDTLNKNLSKPIPEFSPNAKLSTMRKATGETSEDAVRRAAKKIRPDK